MAGNLSPLELLAPTAFVLALIYLLGPLLPWRAAGRGFRSSSPSGWWSPGICTGGCSRRAAGAGEWYEIGWIWLCFAIELLAIADPAHPLRHIPAHDRPPCRGRPARGAAACLPPESCRRSTSSFRPTTSRSRSWRRRSPARSASTIPMSTSGCWTMAAAHGSRNSARPKGVGYLNRPDNAHAKAGNINHALTQTNGRVRRDFRRRLRAAAQFPDAHRRLLLRSQDRDRADAACLLQSRPDAGEPGAAQVGAGRAALLLRRDHAEPRCLGCGVLLRLELGDAPRGAACHRRCAADRLDHRRHAADHDAAAQRLRHALSVRAPGLRPGA